MLVDVHTHIYNHRGAVQSVLSSAYLNGDVPKNQFFSCGVHPWYADLEQTQQFSIALEKHTNPNLIGIGECGLDRIKGPGLEIQKEVFEMHLKLADKLKLPVIIHQVKTISDLMPFLKKYNSLTYIMHGYNGNEVQTKSLLAYDVYFSFGEILENISKKLNASIDIIPLNRLFLETDESDSDIADYYKLMSSAKHVIVKELAQQILCNFKTVFKRDFNGLD